MGKPGQLNNCLIENVPIAMLYYSNLKTKIFCLILLYSSPTFCQVPVRKEPRHHIAFENNKIRILNVLINPGDTTLYHIHSTPSFFVCLTKTKTGEQRINSNPTSGVSIPGQVWFENLSYPHIKMHRVFNLDNSIFHVMDVEILSGDSGFARPPIAFEYSKLIVDTPWGRAYKIDLPVKGTILLPNTSSTLIVVALHSLDLEENKENLVHFIHLDQGEFIYLSENSNEKLINNTKVVCHFVVLEIK